MDRLIISGVIIEAAISDVTKGGPIKSFTECPGEVVQNDSTVNYAWPPRDPHGQLPTIQRLIKKSLEKFARTDSGYLRAGSAPRAFPHANSARPSRTVDNVNCGPGKL
ncbi:unnamed protein product, partial [Iphiclides podalirius]